MIYVCLLIDYIVCNICNINSYFILIELDKRNIVDVIICGLIMDLLFGKLFYFSVVILLIYGIFRMINFKKRYVILKNILIIVMFIIFREFMHIFI